ncbi:MAG: ROK family protein [Clostridiales bacterium]|nr:ROK family protein [Clostridiales bacterium]
MGKNINLIKAGNLNILRRVLKEKRVATKPQLSELTGLSVVTINSLVNYLLENREIIEGEMLPSGGGRPAVSYKFNSEYKLALIIYMNEYNGENTAYIAVVNLYGEIIEKYEKVIREIDIYSFDNIIEDMTIKYPNIGIISFGMPVVEVNGRLLISDYKELENTFFTSYIKEKFNIPVLIENDINLAIAGYCFSNNISTKKTAIGIYFPNNYPPGAGIYINGKIHKGRNGLAGEIKYLPHNKIYWESFDYNLNKIREIIAKTILSFNCMYNPDLIVVYNDKIDETIIEEVTNNCNSEIERVMIPEIIISKEIDKDFEIGIKHITLKELESYKE